MSGQFDFQREIDLAVNFAKGRGITPATMVTDLTAIQTALGTDTTTHDATLETPPAALDWRTETGSFRRKAKYAVNNAKGGNASAANMATWLGPIITALGSDTTTHDITIEKTAAVLNPGFQHSGTGGIP